MAVKEPKWFIHLKYGILVASILIGWGVREVKHLSPIIKKDINGTEDRLRSGIKCQIHPCGALTCQEVG